MTIKGKSHDLVAADSWMYTRVRDNMKKKSWYSFSVQTGDRVYSAERTRKGYPRARPRGPFSFPNRLSRKGPHKSMHPFAVGVGVPPLCARSYTFAGRPEKSGASSSSSQPRRGSIDSGRLGALPCQPSGPLQGGRLGEGGGSVSPRRQVPLPPQNYYECTLPSHFLARTFFSTKTTTKRDQKTGSVNILF